MLRLIREKSKIGLEEVRGQGRGIREEMEKIEGEMTRRKELWEVERGEMEEMIRDLGKRLEEVEERGGGKMERVKERLVESEKKSAEGGGESQGQGNAEVAQVTIDRLKEMELAIERKEREERRGNIVLRGARIEKGRKKEGLKKIMQVIGVEVEVKDMWEVGAKKGGETGIWIARLGNREKKRRVMGRKSLFKGREERIEEDLTWAERRMKWKLREIAAIEERRGNRVRMGYAKIWIEGKM
ncbi:ribonuclease Y-like [Neodiprion pinetum]|uniref:ribonuclease Y-like n=1 Tax=Neodiprion pinetum TaxID=441929 RepID=UPI003722D8F3